VERVRLPHETVHLFRVSHLRFGREEAFRRSCRALLNGAGPDAPERQPHPCLTAGDEVVLRVQQPSGREQHERIFYGEGDGAKCSALIAKLLPAAAACTAWSVGCSALSVSPTRSFYGAGNYFYTAKQLEHSLNGTRPSGGVLNVSAADYWYHARRMCASPWAATKAAWDESEWKHVRYGCFSGLYISQLLRTSHGLPEEAKLVSVARSFDGTVVDWTLGSLLFEVALSGRRGAAAGSRALRASHGRRAAAALTALAATSAVAAPHGRGATEAEDGLPQGDVGVGERSRSRSGSSAETVDKLPVRTVLEMLDAFLPHSCRVIIMMPLWCLVPLGWAILLLLLTWLAGCAWARRMRSRTRRNGVGSDVPYLVIGSEGGTFPLCGAIATKHF